MTGGLGIEFRTDEVDGVPLFWADAPGPCSAGLLFRVGRADEALAGGGITHLVEHLALLSLGPRRYDVNAGVSGTVTSFYATGEVDEVTRFLWDVCHAIQRFPTERIDAEKRVLATEDSARATSLTVRLLTLRYGAAGHGLAGFEQFGLRWLGPDHVRRWAHERFTRHNAALWMTRPPPPDLRLPLGDGVRIPPPAPVPIAGLTLPAWAAQGSGAIAVTLEADRSPALDMAMSAIADRAHDDRGLSDHVAAWSIPLTGERGHKLVGVDCADEHAAAAQRTLLALFDDVASDGPAEAELADGLEAVRRALSADEAVAGGLDQIATDELLGGPRRGKEDLLAEAEAVTAASAAGALRAALDTQLVLAPAGTPRPDRPLAGYPWFSPSAVTGAELRPAGAQPRLGPRRPSPRLVVGPDGASHEGLEPGTISTVRYSDLAAALQEPDGSLTLVGRDAAAVTLDVTAYPGARAAVAEVERRLPPELLVPPRAALAGGGHDLDALAGRKLARPARAAEELALLRGRLDEGESAVNLAEAAIGYKVGLLALTDRRVIWLYRGVAGTPEHKELPYDHVLGVRLSGRRGRTLTLASPVGETGFSDLRPRERGPELLEEIRRRAAQAGAPG